MHIFLTGPRHIGKSTVIQKTISLLQEGGLRRLAGFLTYWGTTGDSYLYIAAADPALGHEPCRLAEFKAGSLICHAEVFDQLGVELLSSASSAQVICLDELGFLEAGSRLFKQKVLSCLKGDVPLFGVLRQGDIPWHEPIKSHPRVTLYEVNAYNREQLPCQLAALLHPYIESG
ncbi:MAG: nucleoside-triphosphatase [Clostridiales bacterium]|nr:nucleoside-triphosphatase [Clostridiales bacterium]